MTNTDINPVAADWANFKKQVKENKFWFIVMGICMIILGLISIAFPLVSTISAKLVIGWLILFAGIMLIVYAFQTKTWKGFFIDILLGIAYLIVGAWLSFYPMTGLKGLTALVGILFIVEGGFRGYMAYKMRPIDGWGWVMFSAVTSVIAGVLILVGLPDSSNWVLGLLVGINFLTTGMSLIFLTNATADALGTFTDDVDAVAAEVEQVKDEIMPQNNPK